MRDWEFSGESKRQRHLGALFSLLHSVLSSHHPGQLLLLQALKVLFVYLFVCLKRNLKDVITILSLCFKQQQRGVDYTNPPQRMELTRQVNNYQGFFYQNRVNSLPSISSLKQHFSFLVYSGLLCAHVLFI